jgi:hypothetical protein
MTVHDTLDDIGEKASDETLVLTVIRDLNDQFHHLCSFQPYNVSFPSFPQTRSALVLEEAQKKTNASNAAATALRVYSNSGLPLASGERTPSGRGNGFGITDSCFPTPPSSYNTSSHGSGYGNHGRRERGGGRVCGRDNNPWMFNPWTGVPTRTH